MSHPSRPDCDYLVSRVAIALASAERGQSHLTPDALAIPGMTSTPIRHFLNSLCDFEGCSYLEVGSFLGATLVAASFRAGGYFAAIDNFSEFNPHGDSGREFHANLRRFERECCVAFHERDCWEMAKRLPDKMFNVYFYDGAHDRASQEDGVARFARCVQDSFVLMVDDWNLEEARSGTNAALDKLGYSVVRGWEFLTDRNGDPETWWNGFWIGVISRDPR